MSYVGRSILPFTLAGGVASLLGLLTIALRARLGAELAFPFRVALVPLELPFFFSFQLSERLWNDPVNDLYNHIYFSMVAYFVAGVAIYTLFLIVKHKVLYGAAIAVLAATIVCGLIWQHQSRGAGHLVDDFTVIQRGWARMPLWVKGNADSGIILLFLHGGPGDTAIEKHLSGGFSRLERDFAVAYWDQRASGNSTGGPADAVVSVGDRVDDLRQVVRLCQQQYRPRALFLIGHSAGGELGTRYLIDTSGEGHVAGWIEVDGAHNEPLGWKLSIAWLRRRAQQRIESATTQQERRFWEKAGAYATRHVHRENWYETEFWDEYIGPAGGYDHGQGPAPTGFRGEFHYLFSRASFLTERFNLMHSKRVFRDSLATDYTPDMNKITVPTLLLWGEHDGATPVGLAQDAYDALGTPAADKRIVIFDRSAHNPMNEEPEKFYREVKAFVDRYAHSGIFSRTDRG